MASQQFHTIQGSRKIDKKEKKYKLRQNRTLDFRLRNFVMKFVRLLHRVKRASYKITISWLYTVGRTIDFQILA
jgi:hypothetical protein